MISKFLKNGLLIFLPLSLMLSCNNESIDDDSQNLTPEEEQDIRTTTPCAFSLSNLNQGDVITIDCLLDLDGQTVNIPENVTLEFDGGDIINGTLNFANEGRIDGRLLNSSLGIEGSAQLIDAEFTFIASRWELTEGNVNIGVSRSNLDAIQNTVDLTKSLGASTFIVNQMDAFFDIEDPGAVGKVAMIKMPSDFHFKMSDQTHLRVFPTNKRNAIGLILIQEVTNVKVSGGFLHGDRDEHGPDLTGGILLEIKGGQDVVVDGVTMLNSAWTGLTINSIGRLGNPIPDGTDYFPSKNVLISSCILNNNAGNNLSITDGEDIIIDGCQFIKSGRDTEFSRGRAPQAAIDIEPFQGQRVERVIIRNNTEREGARIGFLASGGKDILIEDNDTELGIGWNEATKVHVINNVCGGVNGGFFSAHALSVSEDNIISGNTIRGASEAIVLSNDDIKVFDNTMINCRGGIRIRGLKDSEIYNNTFESNIEASFGFIFNNFSDNVTIRDNRITAAGRSFLIEGLNGDESEIDYKISIENNNFNCENIGRISFSKGVELKGNNFNGTGFGLTSSSNIDILENTIIGTSDNPTFAMNNNNVLKNINIIGNTLDNRSSGGNSYGIRINTIGDTFVDQDANIKIEDNTIKTTGGNFVIHSIEISGITINNNIMENTGDNCCIIPFYFRGNNSIITNNQVSKEDSTSKEIDIDGVNNTINNNTLN
ncbi:right-handed parallel beta-helix repeat-containing protein [uncultured Algibacter sp.]|uniref:NosD domain-containing protein n=1 Tax=uncultured Algibacter sp. TaxID=298659 RepID=UPI00321783AD